MSADVPGALNAFRKENNVKHLLLSDFPRRNMLKAYDAIVTDDKSPIVGYAKRARFASKAAISSPQVLVKAWMKV